MNRDTVRSLSIGFLLGVLAVFIARCSLSSSPAAANAALVEAGRYQVSTSYATGGTVLVTVIDTATGELTRQEEYVVSQYTRMFK